MQTPTYLDMPEPESLRLKTQRFPTACSSVISTFLCLFSQLNLREGVSYNDNYDEVTPSSLF